MTSPAVPQTSSAAALTHFRTDAAALSDLSGDDMLRLRMAVAEFHSAGKRLIGELYVMTVKMREMQEILGDRFRAFAKSELGLEPRTVSRYMHINKVLTTHFMTDGAVSLTEANVFTQSALALLSPATDTQVIDDLRELASQGKTIDQNIVLEVISKNEEEAVAKLASTQADLTAMTRELESVRQAREVERARAQRELASQAEMLRRGEERAKDLEGEIQKLSSQATEVRFQEKDALKRQREEASREVQELAERQKQLQAAVEQTNAGAAKFMEMKDQADALIAQFPLALLRSLSESDPTVKTAISTLGQTMILLGQQLAKAGT
jgi:hypothetical protein